MKYQVSLAPAVTKFLTKVTKQDRYRIIKGLLSLRQDPFLGKKLKGMFAGFYSIRVWPYRIIYDVRQKECLVFVIRIGSRKDVYRCRS
ncbi:MAG: hypothetical protein A2788_00645 [Candidatus Abawacabacteria bacterium RIFCSPHIGHO2_01_FULL_46_8]|uniref:Addiction module toxin RelE n=1 Tax=Candidatus Abawacabacteria bacterium RIFCSPHIGHO2_01_FULL_46_8 TaxID=1817815 RepID=A0A1F4XJZ3_9BACT|nr:MAG: hypothetical protein A2788_00645 [Candidatus Abawacabacteria bacterium RIFCSPHIGHO2_01_FULL_46_8]